ncbi:MAG: HD domain-containing protein [Eubacteriales bacterium]|nr:HD domain-containing protein [Eubacteriales bacterium]
MDPLLRFKQQLPASLSLVWQRLNEAIAARGEAEFISAEAYLVGGAVRDILLGLPVHDFDLASPLRPEEIKQIFPEYLVLDTGIAHGTVSICLAGESFELTSFRSEGPYLDGRRPAYVRFESSLEQDLGRRDFTINAMALSLAGELIDPYHGLADLRSGIIRAVGDPELRFAEDPLRLMRAVRFANRLGFRFAKQSEAALIKQAKLIRKISRERIASEFLQILEANPRGIMDLHRLGILKEIFPDLDATFDCQQEGPWHLYNVGEHSVKLAEFKKSQSFRLAALLHDLGKVKCKSIDQDGVAHFYGHAAVSAELAAKILAQLFIPKKERKMILRAIALHDYTSKKPAKIARLVRAESPETLALLIDLKRGDIAAQSEYKRAEKLALLEAQESLIKQFLSGPHKLSHLAIKGSDLYSLGYRGAAIGERLAELLAFVMEDPARNRRELLLARAAKML